MYLGVRRDLYFAWGCMIAKPDKQAEPLQSAARLHGGGFAWSNLCMSICMNAECMYLCIHASKHLCINHSLSGGVDPCLLNLCIYQRGHSEPRTDENSDSVKRHLSRTPP